jgi:hypothetical protein
MKSSVIFLINLVFSEGYFCPYPNLGFDGSNDLLYDYYIQENNYWIRLNQTGWISRSQYCSDKNDSSKHPDAGPVKCNDSQGTCIYSNGNCLVDNSKKPDCLALCSRIINNNGLPCLGECPSGYQSRSQIYSICSKRKCSRIVL